jgi:hypothetical protein
MPRVSLYFQEKSTHVLHQTIYSLGRVKHFTFDESPNAHSDYVVTFGVRPTKSENWWDRVPRSRKIAVLMENPKIFWPSDGYLSEHAVCVTPASLTRANTKFFYSHGAVPWFYGQHFRTDKGLSHERASDDGTPDLSFHLERTPVKKTKLLSLITSTKEALPGHKLRVSLARKISDYFGKDNVDLFGFGHNPLARKETAVDPYLHTIVIENDFIGSYMTEKICDALLGFCNPIYLGAPNVQNFFDGKVDVLTNKGTTDTELNEMLKEIRSIVDRSVDQDSIARNRLNVMLKINLFYHLASIIDNNLM